MRILAKNKGDLVILVERSPLSLDFVYMSDLSVPGREHFARVYSDYMWQLHKMFKNLRFAHLFCKMDAEESLKISVDSNGWSDYTFAYHSLVSNRTQEF